MVLGLATGAPWQCEREGFAARSSGEEREANPYNLAPTPDARPWLKKVQRDMAATWWKGWDKAHRQLSLDVGAEMPPNTLSPVAQVPSLQTA